MTHGCLLAEVTGYRIAVLHLDPFSYRKRQEELSLVLKTIEKVRHLSGKKNWILMGDFNSFSPMDRTAYTDNRYRNRILEQPLENPHRNNLNAGAIDYSIHYKLLDEGYVDALKTKYPEFIHTYPTRRFYTPKEEPVWIRYRLYLSECRPARKNRYGRSDPRSLHGILFGPLSDQADFKITGNRSWRLCTTNPDFSPPGIEPLPQTEGLPPYLNRFTEQGCRGTPRNPNRCILPDAMLLTVEYHHLVRDVRPKS